jgi:hypothetical protein
MTISTATYIGNDSFAHTLDLPFLKRHSDFEQKRGKRGTPAAAKYVFLDTKAALRCAWRRQTHHAIHDMVGTVLA